MKVCHISFGTLKNCQVADAFDSILALILWNKNHGHVVKGGGERSDRADGFSVTPQCVG